MILGLFDTHHALQTSSKHILAELHAARELVYHTDLLHPDNRRIAFQAPAAHHRSQIESTHAATPVTPPASANS